MQTSCVGYKGVQGLLCLQMKSTGSAFDRRDGVCYIEETCIESETICQVDVVE